MSALLSQLIYGELRIAPQTWASFDTTFTHDPADPWAVRITFNPGRKDANEWCFGVDLLNEIGSSDQRKPGADVNLTKEGRYVILHLLSKDEEENNTEAYIRFQAIAITKFYQQCKQRMSDPDVAKAAEDELIAVLADILSHE